MCAIGVGRVVRAGVGVGVGVGVGARTMAGLAGTTLSAGLASWASTCTSPGGPTDPPTMRAAKVHTTSGTVRDPRDVLTA